MQVLIRAVCAAALAMSGAVVAAPAVTAEEIPVEQVVLHNLPRNFSWGPRVVRVWIPKSAEYYTDMGITRENGFRTVHRVAKSDGQQVYVKVGKKWVAVPYSYRAPGHLLHYEESLRLVMGLSRDPLGAPKPKYVYPYAPPQPPPVPSSPRFTDDPGVVRLLGTGWREAMLARVNAMRAEVGSPPARMCLPLNDSATYKSQNMAVVGYGHATPDPYPKVSAVAWESGGRGVDSENIALDFRSVGEVLDAWRNSPGHYRNIIRPEHAVMGFGAAVATDGSVLWTQHFSREGSC